MCVHKRLTLLTHIISHRYLHTTTTTPSSIHQLLKVPTAGMMTSSRCKISPTITHPYVIIRVVHVTTCLWIEVCSLAATSMANVGRPRTHTCIRMRAYMHTDTHTRTITRTRLSMHTCKQTRMRIMSWHPARSWVQRAIVYSNGKQAPALSHKNAHSPSRTLQPVSMYLLLFQCSFLLFLASLTYLSLSSINTFRANEEESTMLFKLLLLLFFPIVIKHFDFSEKCKKILLLNEFYIDLPCADLRWSENSSKSGNPERQCGHTSNEDLSISRCLCKN